MKHPLSDLDADIRDHIERENGLCVDSVTDSDFHHRRSQRKYKEDREFFLQRELFLSSLLCEGCLRVLLW